MADESLLAAARSLVADAAARDAWLFDLRVAGIGWATVELERAAEEVAAAFAKGGIPAPRWSPAPRDELLGAMAWMSREWWPAEGMDAVSTKAEGGLSSEAGVLEEQARQAKPLDDEENLLGTNGGGPAASEKTAVG